MTPEAPPPKGTQPAGQLRPLASPGETVDRRERIFEVVATLILAVATIGTAWSGYQATRWSGVQAAEYVSASGSRVEATKAATQAGQDRLYDSQVFSQWLNAHVSGDERLAMIYERRFRDEFQVAFAPWLATDPFNDPEAPPGPLFMPEYRSAKLTASEELEAQATALFQAGQDANEISDRYVLNTVFFASALFLAGIAGRFTWSPARIAVLAVSAVSLIIGLLNTLQLPIE